MILPSVAIRAREKKSTQLEAWKAAPTAKQFISPSSLWFYPLAISCNLLQSLEPLPALSTIGDLLDFPTLCSTELPRQHNGNEATPGTVNSDCEYPERRWHSFGSMCFCVPRLANGFWAPHLLQAGYLQWRRPQRRWSTRNLSDNISRTHIRLSCYTVILDSRVAIRYPRPIRYFRLEYTKTIAPPQKKWRRRLHRPESYPEVQLSSLPNDHG